MWDLWWWLAAVFDHLRGDAHRTVLNALTNAPVAGARLGGLRAVEHLLREARSDVAILDDRLQSFTGDADPGVRARAERAADQGDHDQDFRRSSLAWCDGANQIRMPIA